MQGLTVRKKGSDAVDMTTESGSRRAYRLVLAGELGDRFETLFDGMALSRQGGNTVLVGTVKDQAHLAGILERAQELGLDLISVGDIQDSAAGESRRGTE